MSDFVRAAAVDEIPENGMKAITVGHDRIVICNVGDKYYAFADECTHDSAPISTGFLKRGMVICPRHGARFDVTTGAVTAPPAVAPLETYEVKVEGNDILVKLD